MYHLDLKNHLRLHHLNQLFRLLQELDHSFLFQFHRHLFHLEFDLYQNFLHLHLQRKPLVMLKFLL
jgi:hypothetical protein